MKPVLSVVVPTYNERENIADLLSQLLNVLQSLSVGFEIIVVDDNSPDGTGSVVQGFSERSAAVRLLLRQGERDLSTAIAAGFNAAVGEFVVVMDADMQHDPSLVPVLLHAAQTQAVDLVIATRYAKGGSVRQWSKLRSGISRVVTWWVQHYLRCAVSDPLSGFFLLRLDSWLRVREKITPQGFKLLLAILMAEPSLRCVECGYVFAKRQHGHSKLSVKPVWALFAMLRQLRKTA